MKTKLLLICAFATIQLAGQNHCRYGIPHNFDSYRIRVQTEQAGLFSDAYTVGRSYYQFEGNGFGAPFRNNYGTDIYGALFKLRVGIGQHTEVQSGAAHAYPIEIRPYDWQEGRMYAGIKQEIFSNRKTESWKLAVSLNYIYQDVQSESGKAAHGANLNAYNSWSVGRILYIDITYGICIFLNRELQQSSSWRIVMKEEDAKFGIFMGLIADNYIESNACVGFVITDNYNFILNLSIGFFDHASCPNITYTHKMKYTKKINGRHK